MISFHVTVSQMAWEVIMDMTIKAKYGLWGSNVKTGEYSPEAIRGQFLVLHWT